jgi:polysaccharide biosynthesis protein PslJ
MAAMTDQTGLHVPKQSIYNKTDAVALLTFYLFFVIAIPSRLVFAPLGGAGSPSTIIGFAFFGWYVLNWLHPSSSISRGPQPMRRAAIFFLCAVLAAYVSAATHALPTLEQNGADRGIILTCGWLGALLWAADGIDRFERLRTLLRRLVFGATAMALLGIVQFFTSLNAAQYIIVPGLSIQQAYTDIQVRNDFNRPSATAIHPIEFGFVLALILPLAIHQARYAPPGLRLRRWLQVAAISVTLPMTVSRSAILGLAVSMIIILPTWSRRERWTAYLVMLFSLFALRAVIPGLIGTLRNLFLSIGSGSDSSAESRTIAFQHAAPLISAHPLFGQGFGTFLPNILFYTDDQYLNSLIEIGAIGLAALLGTFATGWFLARSARRATADAEIRHLAQCLTASIAVIIVGYATFDALYFPMAAALTFLMLGCVAAAWRLLRAGVSDPELGDHSSLHAGLL